MGFGMEIGWSMYVCGVLIMGLSGGGDLLQ